MSEGIEPQNFDAMSGETVRITPLPITNADGTPTDITGCTFRFFMARRPKDAPVVRNDGGTPNCTVTVLGVATAGTVRVTIPSATTNLLDGTYNWELWLTDVASDEVCVARGYGIFKTSVGPNPA